MMRKILMKYPLDLSGKSPTNLVLGEVHDVNDVRRKAICTNWGPFYTDSMVVRNAATGTVLKPLEDYLVLQPYQEVIEKTGLNVCSVVYVKNASVTSIQLDYQVVGGEYSWTTYALRELLEAVDLDNRPVAWGDVIGKPAYYPPTPHLHDLGDTYGWEYIAQQLEGVRSAILTGDEESHQELRKLLILMIDDLGDIVDNVKSMLLSHVGDSTNPHNVSKTQVGLSNIPNDLTDSRTAFSNSTLLTAKGMADHVQSGDHDARYVRINAEVDGSIRVVNGKAEVRVGGTWKQFWPPLWQ